MCGAAGIFHAGRITHFCPFFALLPLVLMDVYHTFPGKTRYTFEFVNIMCL